MNLICAMTILVGLSNPVTEQESKVLAAAKAGCARQYPEAPCLKKLIKKEEFNYHAICGAKTKSPSSFSNYKEHSPDDFCQGCFN